MTRPSTVANVVTGESVSAMVSPFSPVSGSTQRPGRARLRVVRMRYTAMPRRCRAART
jgi:hypothetical protein